MSDSPRIRPSLERIKWYDEKNVFLFTRDIGENGPYVMATRVWFDESVWFFFVHRKVHAKCKSSRSLIDVESPEFKLIVKAYEELIEREATLFVVD